MRTGSTSPIAWSFLPIISACGSDAKGRRLRKGGQPPFHRRRRLAPAGAANGGCPAFAGTAAGFCESGKNGGCPRFAGGGRRFCGARGKGGQPPFRA
jgi:hypothetical protein